MLYFSIETNKLKIIEKVFIHFQRSLWENIKFFRQDENSKQNELKNCSYKIMQSRMQYVPKTFVTSLYINRIYMSFF